MACKKTPKGAKRETFFSQSKDRPDSQAKYEAEKAAALISEFSQPKPDPNETT